MSDNPAPAHLNPGNRQTLLEQSLVTLPDKPEETPHSALCALWHFTANNPLSCQKATRQALPELTAQQCVELGAAVRQRIAGTPLAYIVGRQEFMGLELLAGPAALIPRKETEQLAQVCLDFLQTTCTGGKACKVIDLFTGSGNLPLCFQQAFPDASVYGADISAPAIELANRNAAQLGLPVRFLEGDMFAPLDDPMHQESFDLVSGAPPYISASHVASMATEISAHEPSLAFDAGPFGLVFFMRLLDESPRFLRAGGCLAFEVGLGQGEALARRIQKEKRYQALETHQDAEGKIRVISCRRA